MEETPGWGVIMSVKGVSATAGQVWGPLAPGTASWGSRWVVDSEAPLTWSSNWVGSRRNHCFLPILFLKEVYAVNNFHQYVDRTAVLILMKRH